MGPETVGQLKTELDEAIAELGKLKIEHDLLRADYNILHREWANLVREKYKLSSCVKPNQP